MVKESFENYLKEIRYPTSEERKKEHWDIEGIPHKVSNQLLKFDIRPMFAMDNDQSGKEILVNSKADKISFETTDSWILVDTQELIEYFKSNNSQKQHLDDLIKDLEWNIILDK